MSFQITIEGQEKLTAAGEFVLSRRKAVQLMVRQELELFGQKLVRRSKADYLSGPRPSFLGVVTGRLRRSIAYEIEEKDPAKLELTFGTNVEYARIHEKGGPVVRKGKTIFIMKERPFLRPSWAEELPVAQDRLHDLLTEIAGRMTPNG